MLLASLCFWRCCILCAGSGRRPDPEGAAAVVAAAAAMLRKTVRSHVPLQGMHKNVEWLIIFFYQVIEIRIQFVIAEYFWACARSQARFLLPWSAKVFRRRRQMFSVVKALYGYRDTCKDSCRRSRTDANLMKRRVGRLPADCICPAPRGAERMRERRS